MNIARIEAAFANCDGRTRAARLIQSAPLKIARTFALENGALGICLMDASPGMLAGDCYQFDFVLAEQARVEVTAQGFTRVHPSRENPCAMQTRLKVGARAQLQWFPEPLMLYADADLCAQTTVKLAPTATFLAHDIWCAGRTGRGEIWQFARHRNRWNIERAGIPLYASSLDIEPANFDVHQNAAWGNWTHTGNFWAFCAYESGAVAVDFDAHLCETFWEIIERKSNILYAGASILANGGVTVSMLGRRAHDLQELTRELRDQTRLVQRHQNAEIGNQVIHDEVSSSLQG